MRTEYLRTSARMAGFYHRVKHSARWCQSLHWLLWSLLTARVATHAFIICKDLRSLPISLLLNYRHFGHKLSIDENTQNGCRLVPVDQKHT